MLRSALGGGISEPAGGAGGNVCGDLMRGKRCGAFVSAGSVAQSTGSVAHSIDSVAQPAGALAQPLEQSPARQPASHFPLAQPSGPQSVQPTVRHFVDSVQVQWSQLFLSSQSD